MHMVNLGLWKDLLECIFVDMKETLQAPTLTSLTPSGGSKTKKLFSEKAYTDLLGEVKKRLGHYTANTCGFTVEPKIRNIAAYLMERNADKHKGSKGIKARQHNQLMMVRYCFISYYCVLQCVIDSSLTGNANCFEGHHEETRGSHQCRDQERACSLEKTIPARNRRQK